MDRDLSIAPIMKDPDKKKKVIEMVNNAKTKNDIIRLQTILKKYDGFFNDTLKVDGKVNDSTLKYLKTYLRTEVMGDKPEDIMNVVNNLKTNSDNRKEDKQIINKLQDY